jgi:hypothetical protein
MRIEAGVGPLVQRIRDDQAQVGYSVVGRAGGRVMPFVIHNIHMEEMRKRGFSDLGSKLVVMVSQWFGLKTTATVSWFEPQNQGRRFGDLSLKITVAISWFVPQNQVEGGLLVCASKPIIR